MKKLLAVFCVITVLVTTFSCMALAEEKTKVVVWTNARANYDYMMPIITSKHWNWRLIRAMALIFIILAIQYGL